MNEKECSLVSFFSLFLFFLEQSRAEQSRSKL